MNRITKFLAWLCIITCCLSCVSCEKKAEPQPILKVITSSQIGVTIFSYKRYYAIYDNGKKKKISEFSPTEVESYLFGSSNYDDSSKVLYSIDLNTEEGIQLNEIATKIIALTEEADKVHSPGALYVISEKYYFAALINKGYDSLADALFEYNVEENTFKKIATFSSSITHVEAYQ